MTILLVTWYELVEFSAHDAWTPKISDYYKCINNNENDLFLLLNEVYITFFRSVLFVYLFIIIVFFLVKMSIEYLTNNYFSLLICFCFIWFFSISVI